MTCSLIRYVSVILHKPTYHYQLINSLMRSQRVYLFFYCFLHHYIQTWLNGFPQTLKSRSGKTWNSLTCRHLTHTARQWHIPLVCGGRAWGSPPRRSLAGRWGTVACAWAPWSAVSAVAACHWSACPGSGTSCAGSPSATHNTFIFHSSLLTVYTEIVFVIINPKHNRFVTLMAKLCLVTEECTQCSERPTYFCRPTSCSLSF